MNLGNVSIPGSFGESLVIDIVKLLDSLGEAKIRAYIAHKEIEREKLGDPVALAVPNYTDADLSEDIKYEIEEIVDEQPTDHVEPN